MLSTAVEDVLRRPLEPVSPGLRTAFAYVELRYAKVASRDELVRGSPRRQPDSSALAARMLEKLERAAKRFRHRIPIPYTPWRLGTQMLVIGMGAETVVDYALRFKKEFGPGTWFAVMSTT